MKKMRTWAEIDLDALAHNIREIKKKLKKETLLMGVVKANAYGHGVCAVAREILENGADRLAVAFADEGVELRKAGFDVPILILGNSVDDDIEKIIEFRLTPTVSDTDFAQKLSDAAADVGKVADVHIKLDTGMSRIGLAADETAVEEIRKIHSMPGIFAEGLFTHFATADEEDESFTKLQFQRFENVMKALEKEGIDIPIKHVCNSAAIIKFPEMQLDMVRAGIIMYGIYPSSDFDKALIDLRSVMTFKSRISHIKVLEKGEALSYGRTFVLEQKSRIATVSVGYADGYFRGLSNKAVMMVGGKKAKQSGRICMDQCMIDISDVNNINVGDEVVLFGGNDEAVSAENIAELLGTIGYELVCAVGRRVPRIYIKNGKVEGLLDYLL